MDFLQNENPLKIYESPEGSDFDRITSEMLQLGDLEEAIVIFLN